MSRCLATAQRIKALFAAGVARSGQASFGMDRSGKAGRAMCVSVSYGEFRQGRHVPVRFVEFRHG